jgi:hypothetical protein
MLETARAVVVATNREPPRSEKERAKLCPSSISTSCLHESFANNTLCSSATKLIPSAAIAKRANASVWATTPFSSSSPALRRYSQLPTRHHTRPPRPQLPHRRPQRTADRYRKATHLLRLLAMRPQSLQVGRAILRTRTSTTLPLTRRSQQPQTQRCTVDNSLTTARRR